MVSPHDAKRCERVQRWVPQLLGLSLELQQAAGKALPLLVDVKIHSQHCKFPYNQVNVPLIRVYFIVFL